MRLDLRGATPAGPAQVWRFAGDGPDEVRPETTRLPDAAFAGGSLTLTLPPVSVTVLSLPTR